MKHNRIVTHKKSLAGILTRKEILYLIYINDRVDWYKPNGGLDVTSESDPFEIMAGDMHTKLQGMYNEMSGTDGYNQGKEELNGWQRNMEIHLRVAKETYCHNKTCKSIKCKSGCQCHLCRHLHYMCFPESYWKGAKEHGVLPDGTIFKV